MKKPLIYLAALLPLLWLAPGAAAQPAGAPAAGPPAAGTRNLPCNKDFVGNVDSSGNVIRLGSGQLFEVFPGDNRFSLSWQPLDKVTVCALGGGAARITNLDPRRGSVRAIRQY